MIDFKLPVSLIFYDTECTSFRVYDDHVVQIGAVQHFWHPPSPAGGGRGALSRPDEPREFCEYIYTDRPMHRDAERITGISAETIKDAKPFREVALDFFNWMRNSSRGHPIVLIGHNSDIFDFRIMCQEMERHALCPHRLWASAGLEHTFDLMVWMRRQKLTHTPDGAALPMTKSGKNTSYSLGGVYEAFFREPFEAHDALGDSKAVARIYHALLREQFPRLVSYGVEWRAGLNRFVDIRREDRRPVPPPDMECIASLPAAAALLLLHPHRSSPPPLEEEEGEDTDTEVEAPPVEIIQTTTTTATAMTATMTTTMTSRVMQCTECEVTYSTHFSHECKSSYKDKDKDKDKNKNKTRKKKRASNKAATKPANKRRRKKSRSPCEQRDASVFDTATWTLTSVMMPPPPTSAAAAAAAADADANEQNKVCGGELELSLP